MPCRQCQTLETGGDALHGWIAEQEISLWILQLLDDFAVEAYPRAQPKYAGRPSIAPFGPIVDIRPLY
jgi:hypothetical protein